MSGQLQDIVATTRTVGVDGREYALGPLLLEDLALLAERLQQQKQRQRAEQLRVLGVIRRPEDLRTWQEYLEAPLAEEKRDEHGHVICAGELATAMSSFWGARLLLGRNLARHNGLTEVEASTLVRPETLGVLLEALEGQGPKGGAPMTGPAADAIG